MNSLCWNFPSIILVLQYIHIEIQILTMGALLYEYDKALVKHIPHLLGKENLRLLKFGAKVPINFWAFILPAAPLSESSHNVDSDKKQTQVAADVGVRHGWVRWVMSDVKVTGLIVNHLARVSMREESQWGIVCIRLAYGCVCGRLSWLC